MILTIDWNVLSTEQWQSLFAHIPRSNILQSYDYARAAAPHYKQRVRWGVIRIDGKDAGLVQVFETGLFWNAIHAVMVDRGSLWLEGFGSMLHVKLFFDEMNRLFPARFGRRRRFLPEIEDGAAAQKLIAQTGLSRLEDRKGYETVWIDLTQDEESLRANLRQKWRNRLNVGERGILSVSFKSTPDVIDWTAGIYATDKAARGYGGIPPALYRAYAPILSQKNDLLIATALVKDEAVAFTVCVCHGRSATYLIGWASDKGRDLAAHNLLLWESMRILKKQGIKEFDLGGINEDSADGVSSFKEGLGGRIVRTVGHYV